MGKLSVGRCTSVTDILRPVKQLLYAARWAVMIFVFVTVWLVPFTNTVVERVPIMVAVAVIAVATLISVMAARKWEWLRKPILGLIADLLLVTVVIYFSDGIQSPFYALYYITVISAAAEFGLLGALVCATILALISIPVDMAAPGISLTGNAIARDVVRTIPYLFLTAVITGALRNRIRVLDETAFSLQAERAVTEREMEVAARIQRAQLPLQTPVVEGIQIAVTYKPAREVGGDLYDFYPTDESCFGLIAADVSGKGVPAALLLSSCKYAVRESYSEDRSAMMSAVNRHILSVTTDEMFVTMLYGTICRQTGEFRYVNAGHMPPMIVKATGAVECHEYSDPPLGVTPSSRYVERLVKLDPGDTIVLYTDGVTDALSGNNEGSELLRQYLADVALEDIAGWGDKLLARIGTPQHLDDVTLVAVKVA